MTQPTLNEVRVIRTMFNTLLPVMTKKELNQIGMVLLAITERMEQKQCEKCTSWLLCETPSVKYCKFKKERFPVKGVRM